MRFPAPVRFRKSLRHSGAIVSGLLAIAATPRAEPAGPGPIKATVNCSPAATDQGPIGDRFGSVVLWHYLGTTPDERMLHEWAEAKPAGWLKAHYPWLNEVVVYGASGGSYRGYPRQPGDVAATEFDRDLFKDPANRAVANDYDFEPLVRACRNVIRQGLRPCLRLDHVPIKFTKEPKIDWFRLNTRPPDDYRVYADYISALAQAMVDAFGIGEVAHWRWIIGIEIDNRQMWESADGSPDTTMRDFFRFYDWNVFALQRTLGRDLGPVGSHAMTNPKESFWNAERFIEHCRSGVNAATGKTGAPLDFFGVSVYDIAPLPKYGGANLGQFDDKVMRMRAALDRHGYCQVPIEVAEGGLAFGRDQKWLWQGLAIGGSFDASWTALSFQKLLDGNVRGWARWPLFRTEGLFQGIETAGTHALALISRMSGDHRLDSTLAEPATVHGGLIASLSPDRSVVRLLAYHYGPDLTRPEPSLKMAVDLRSLPFAEHAQATIWRIDPAHGDFWPQWEKDRAALHLPADDYVHSEDQVDVLHALNNPAGLALWRSKQSEYERLGHQSSPEHRHLEVTAHAGQLDLVLPCFSTDLIEITQAPRN